MTTRWWLCLVLSACARSSGTAAPAPLVAHRGMLEGSEKRPALVVLHGLGANEHDLFELGRQLAPRSHVIGLRAPNEVGPGAYSWFSVRFTAEGPVHDAAAAESSRARIVEFVRALSREPTVDAARVTLLGFSQGAILSEAIALTEPGLVSRVVLIGGRTLPELKPASSEKKPTVLLLHGTHDERLPYENAVRTNEVLRAAGYAVTFESFEAGHQVTPAMVETMRRWLSAE